MLKKILGVFLLVGCLIFANVPISSCKSSTSIVYVAGDSSGDFRCDGKDDQVQINQALKLVADNPKKYTTVHLKGPFTYVIDDTLLIGSNTILEGDSNTVLKLANNAGWVTMKPLIQQRSSSGNSNIVIRGFEVNGNHDGNPTISKGKGYYNIMYFTNCNNIKVYNMYMHDGLGDGLRANSCKNIQFYNNKVYKLGHDGMFAIRSQNVEAWSNTITCRTNSALRIWNSNHVKLHDNVIDSFYHWSAGGPGIQIEKGDTGTGLMDDIDIYNNIIHNTYGPGIWLVNYDTTSATGDLGKNVHIHHNIFYNTGTNPSITWVGGIVASGFHDTLVENNVFDGIYHAAVVHMWMNENCPSYSSKTGYTTIVRNNIIVNTQKRTKNPSGTGYGVINYLTNKNHKFVLQNNCLYKNAVGNYKNCASTTDIYVNPLFVNQAGHDYHLQSTAGRWNGKTWVKDKVSSPCIDTGYPSSAYSNEPKPNGNRINIGRYGNTIYASLSSASKVKTVQSPLMSSITEVTNETEDNLGFAMESFDANESNFTRLELDPSVDVGQGPVIEDIPEAIVKTGENLNFTVKASSENEYNLTFSVSNLPVGASFDETGLFSWTPSNDQEGIYTVSFEVSDGMLSDSEIVIINVVEEKAPLNHSSVVEEKVSLNLSSVLDEEVPLNLSTKIYNSGLYEVSPTELSLNNLFSYWGK